MIETFDNFVHDHLYAHIVIILICAFALIISMAIDLWFGIQKAKVNGEATTSTGLKKTCDKARKYFSPFLCLMCIDLIGCIILPFPIFSMAWCGYCVYCEFTSVREKSWQKADLRKAERTMNVVIENKEDIAKMVVQLLTKQDHETD